MSHLILLDLTTLKIFSEKYTLRRTSLHNFLHPTITTFSLLVQIFSSASRTLAHFIYVYIRGESRNKVRHELYSSSLLAQPRHFEGYRIVSGSFVRSTEYSAASSNQYFPECFIKHAQKWPEYATLLKLRQLLRGNWSWIYPPLN
jgi:hypothetical protein